MVFKRNKLTASEKKSSTHFTRGLRYANKNNEFNAIESYLESIQIDKELKSINNIGVCYGTIGLQKQAFKQYSHAIKNREKGLISNNLTPLEYTNRADLFRIMGKYDLMESDIRKAFSYKKDFSSAYRVLAAKEIMNCNFKLGIDYLTKIIENDITIKSSWRERAKMYMVIGQYENAIKDYKQLSEMMEKPLMSIYQIGKCYFENGDKESASEFYNRFLQSGEFKASYEIPEYQYGIVQHIDNKKGYGFILGSTWSSSFDSIFFRIKDTKTSINIGERVRFELNYSIHNNLFKANAKQVELWNRISNPDFRKHSIYHGIIHFAKNAFCMANDLKYLYVFYPHSLYYPLDSIPLNIDRKENEDYVFVEFKIAIDENENPIFSDFKRIEKENIFSDKFENKSIAEIGNISSDFWTCNICDGDSSTGCLYFDPTECPKFT